MQCKWCETMIDYDGDVKKAFLQGTEEVHTCQNIPKGGFPKKWTKKEYKPIQNDLTTAATNSRLDELEKEVEKHSEAIRALVKEVSFKKGNEVD